LLCVLIQLHISFFSQATSTSNIYTLSLHDALPILAYNYYPADELPQTADDYKIAKYAYGKDYHFVIKDKLKTFLEALKEEVGDVDRKSTRLNSSHVKISYAVFCLKKKKMT